MILSEVLTQFGLNEKEAKVYLASLELGPASILQIAQKSGVNRSSIYYIIEDLKRKNLMTLTSQKKKQLLVPAEPNEIIKLLQDKEELFKSILPQLDALNNLGVKKPKIIYYEGEEGVYRVIKDYLTARKEALSWGNQEQFDLALKFDPNLAKKRAQKNIFLKLISPDNLKAREWQKNDKPELRKTKIISPEFYPYKVQIILYNNKISITSAKEKIGLIIESEPISETMKMIFNLCWNNIK